MHSQPDDMKRLSCSDDLAATCSNSNKKSRTETDIMIMGSSSSADVSGVIATAAVQYLGVRSLVRFGVTSKSNKAVVEQEIVRRKGTIADIERELKVLMGSDHGKAMREDEFPSIPMTRSNMMKALKLSNHALRLIDDEIDFQTKLGTQEMSWEDDFGVGNAECEWEWTACDIFLEERKKFVRDACKPFGSLVILPECFYCPPGEEDASKPSDDLIKKAHKKAGWIWGAEDHMARVFEWNMDDPNWHRLDYEQPFRKFHLSGADFFTCECMEETARDMAGRGTEDDRMKIEAFRIAARKQVFNTPKARDCLWYTISKADEFFEEAIMSADSEQGISESEGSACGCC
mmetsp:Transcript_10726/g.16328  ORF Transcript_10726/g.16328 Transcript_10726/m.16328 type:complete len:346 (+) Transcript_10726:85-1122(+)